jgi:hypothetical protein
MMQRFSFVFFDLYFFQVDIYCEFTYYEACPSAWRDILAFFGGGFRDGSSGYRFPSEQAAIHFGMLIGQKCAHYERLFAYHWQREEATREMRTFGDLTPF